VVCLCDVTIILPTYNRADLVARCIESVLSQSYTNWELIIADDASTDNTSAIVETYTGDPRIRYHRNKTNQGLPRNRNITIALSRGDLIFFIEDDLTMEPDCLEILVDTYNELKKEKKVGGIAPRLIGEYRGIAGPLNSVVEARRKRLQTACDLDRRTGIVIRNFGIDSDDIEDIITIHACSLYPRDVLNEVGGFAEKYKGTYIHEDNDLNFRIKNNGYNFYFQPKAITYHNVGDTGGCRLSSMSWTHYYTFRNHCIFIARIFGARCLYMIPSYTFWIILCMIRYIFIKVRNEVFR